MWSQGRTLVADKFLCFSQKSLRYVALGTGCTLTTVPTSTFRGTVNEYQRRGLVIIPMEMGECRPIAAYEQTGSKVRLQSGLRVGGHLALTDFRSKDPK